MKNNKAIKKDKMQNKDILKKQAISKMRSETSTLVTFILDESGSMDPVRNETIEGFNSYINNLSIPSKGIDSSFGCRWGRS